MPTRPRARARALTKKRHLPFRDHSCQHIHAHTRAHVGRAFACSVYARVQKNERFFHRVGAPRVLARDGFEDGLFIPYDRLLKRGRVVRGSVTSVDAAAKTVSVSKPDGSTSTEQYDILVCATGAVFPVPFEPLSQAASEAKAAIARLRDNVRSAAAVTVIGGGPVGCELVGEIKAAFPDKTVRLVHGGDKLLNAPGNGNLTDAFRARVLEGVRARGVEVLLNTTATVAAGTPTLANGVFGGGAAHSVTLSTGSSVSSDITVLAFGSRFNASAYQSGSLTSAVRADGSGLATEATLQVTGFPNVFVIGDAATLGDAKMAFIAARSHAPIAKKNILLLAQALAGGRSAESVVPKLARHTPAAKGAMLIPDGPTGGLMAFGDKIMSGFLVKKLKAADLLVKRYALPAPAPGQRAAVWPHAVWPHVHSKLPHTTPVAFIMPPTLQDKC
ncbi:hypothetical protein EON67_00600 [archaeon]|nr:MAG: hypothetical protein EON67_00600 [archaeon]